MADSVFLGSVYATAELRTDKFKEGATQVRSELDSLDSTTSSRMASLGKSFTNTGKALSIGLTAPLVLFGKTAVDTAVDIEVKWKEVQKVYGSTAGAFQKDTEMLQKAVNGLTLKFGQQKDVVVDALASIAAIGYEGPQAVDMLTQSLEFATAGNMALEDAMAGVVAISKIYNVQGDQLRGVLASLNLVENSTAASMSDLNTAIQIVGTSGKSAGVDVNELAGYMAGLRERAIPAGEAADGLKTIFTRLRSQDSIDFLAEFGIQVVDANGKLMEGNQILDAYAKIWPKLTDVEKEEAAQVTAGLFQKNKFLAVIDDLTSKNSTYTKTLELLGNQEGAVSQYTKEMNIFLDTNKTKMAQANAAWTDFKIAVGGIVVEVLVPLMTSLTGLAQQFSNLDPTLQKVIVGVGIFLAVLGPILIFVGMLISAISTILPVLAAVGAAIGAISLPVLAIIAIIVALIAALVILYLKWNEISAFLQNVWNTVVTTVSETWNNFVTWLTTSITTLVTNIINWFGQLPTMIMNHFLKMISDWVWFLGFVLGLVLYGIPAIITTIMKFLSELPGKVLKVLTDVQNWWNQKWTEVHNFVTVEIPKMVANIFKWLMELPPNMWKAMLEMKTKATEGIQSTWESILSELKQWPGRMFEWGKNIMHSFADGIKNAIGAIADAFKSGMDSAKRLVQGKSPPVEGPFKEIDVWGFNVGMAWVDGLKQAISSVSLPSPELGGIGGLQPAPAPVNNMTTLQPNYNVYIGMYAGTPMEKREIARQLDQSLQEYKRSMGEL